MSSAQSGIRAAQWGLLVNAALAAVKLIAGIVGNTYALVADALESVVDIFSSLIVWRGLAIADREPDEEYPFGYGKAESLATIAVSVMLLGAAAAIAIVAVREIRTPHQIPQAWTLAVLVVVMAIKGWLARRVNAVGSHIGSSAVRADAWHHMSDAVTSAAAFVGISVAVIAGPGWESADDWAALAASGLIAYNGLNLVRPAIHDLMDRTADASIVVAVRNAALQVPGVLGVEKVAARKSGWMYRVTVHIQAAPRTTLEEAHALGGRAKAEVRGRLPQVQSVLVHMEPFYEETAGRDSVVPSP